MKTGGYISTEYTAWCGDDVCCEWTQESAFSKSDFIKQIRKAGWKRFGKRWLCPDCCNKQRELKHDPDKELDK